MSDISEALDGTAAQSAPSNESERLDGPDREPKWKGLLEWLGVFVVAFAVFALIRVFVVSPFVVPSGSMEPTILVGDQVFAQRVSAHFGDTPEVGDIVVFKNPVLRFQPRDFGEACRSSRRPDGRHDRRAGIC